MDRRYTYEGKAPPSSLSNAWPEQVLEEDCEPFEPSYDTHEAVAAATADHSPQSAWVSSAEGLPGYSYSYPSTSPFAASFPVASSEAPVGQPSSYSPFAPADQPKEVITQKAELVYNGEQTPRQSELLHLSFGDPWRREQQQHQQHQQQYQQHQQHQQQQQLHQEQERPNHPQDYTELNDYLPLDILAPLPGTAISGNELNFWAGDFLPGGSDDDSSVIRRQTMTAPILKEEPTEMPWNFPSQTPLYGGDAIPLPSQVQPYMRSLLERRQRAATIGLGHIKGAAAAAGPAPWPSPQPLTFEVSNSSAAAISSLQLANVRQRPSLKSPAKVLAYQARVRLQRGALNDVLRDCVWVFRGPNHAGIVGDEVRAILTSEIHEEGEKTVNSSGIHDILGYGTTASPTSPDFEEAQAQAQAQARPTTVEERPKPAPRTASAPAQSTISLTKSTPYIRPPQTRLPRAGSLSIPIASSLTNDQKLAFRRSQQNAHKQRVRALEVNNLHRLLTLCDYMYPFLCADGGGVGEGGRNTMPVRQDTARHVAARDFAQILLQHHRSWEQFLAAERRLISTLPPSMPHASGSGSGSANANVNANAKPNAQAFREASGTVRLSLLGNVDSSVTHAVFPHLDQEIPPPPLPPPSSQQPDLHGLLGLSGLSGLSGASEVSGGVRGEYSSSWADPPSSSMNTDTSRYASPWSEQAHAHAQSQSQSQSWGSTQGNEPLQGQTPLPHLPWSSCPPPAPPAPSSIDHLASAGLHSVPLPPTVLHTRLSRVLGAISASVPLSE